MKGIILAGGKGTRLRPATYLINKHLVPILNKPMVLYPLETLKSLGITDILIVSGGDHIGGFAEFLGDGSAYGVNLTYKVQTEAGGIAQALGLASDFAGGQSVAVILGDNVFDNSTFEGFTPGTLGYAHLFVKKVDDPERFGVLRSVRDDSDFEIIEKPTDPKVTDMAVTGLYIYPNEVFAVVPSLKPSARGELEITDVNNYFIKKRNYNIHEVRGFWSDAGTRESLKKTIDWAYGN